MDNLSSQKRARILQMIGAAGATLLYPPRSSADFNPIETAVAKVNADLKGREDCFPFLVLFRQIAAQR
ncbi:transposase [Bradyrhizobium sp. LM2.7]